MKENIIFSGADATGKTIRSEKLLEQGYSLSVLMKEIDIAQNSIKENIKIALEQGSKNNKTVMDRSIIDLLAYYYVNDKEGLADNNTGIGNLHGIKKLLEEFIILNKGSTLNYMTASKSIILSRLKKRETRGEELSENDLKIINKESYLESFIETFNKVISILERLNKNMGNLIKIEKIDTTNLPKPNLYFTKQN